jgi:murein DD-endopeptidase MepM/ murein hydrolase activator NlpD
MTRFADARAERAEAALRELGLNPATVLRQAEREAMGGPLEKFVSASGGPIDPRFERLGISLARMGALELTLDSVPQVMPASVVRMSSGFGPRRDPFTGGGAMHSGLDFAGPIGTPIQAAANGRVSFVGVKSGYGKVVEIDHGNGLITRYAHLSAFNVKRGAEIRSGERIAAMGSTGRSTGSHLHFEVRLNGRAVNPRTFLERAPDVLEKARSDAPRAQQ